MQRPSLPKQSVSAETSEFFRAELAAFVTMNRRLRPRAWARVEELKRACWRESPMTVEASPRFERVLDRAEARSNLRDDARLHGAGSINPRTRASASPTSDVGLAPTSAAMVDAAASATTAAVSSPAR